VIGASTGGPRVEHQILSDLPRGLSAAVLVVQHIAAGFSVGMTEGLSSASALPAPFRTTRSRMEAREDDGRYLPRA
jgi:two-component system chemotaxis response regulator CheB